MGGQFKQGGRQRPLCRDGNDSRPAGEPCIRRGCTKPRRARAWARDRVICKASLPQRPPTSIAKTRRRQRRARVSCFASAGTKAKTQDHDFFTALNQITPTRFRMHDWEIQLQQPIRCTLLLPLLHSLLQSQLMARLLSWDLVAHCKTRLAQLFPLIGMYCNTIPFYPAVR